MVRIPPSPPLVIPNLIYPQLITSTRKRTRLVVCDVCLRSVLIFAQTGKLTSDLSINPQKIDGLVGVTISSFVFTDDLRPFLSLKSIQYHSDSCCLGFRDHSLFGILLETGPRSNCCNALQHYDWLHSLGIFHQLPIVETKQAH